jgi:hypothetical protein
LQALVLTLRDDPHFLIVYRLLIAAASRKQRRSEQSMKEIVKAIADLTDREMPSESDKPAELAEARREQQ